MSRAGRLGRGLAVCVCGLVTPNWCSSAALSWVPQVARRDPERTASLLAAVPGPGQRARILLKPKRPAGSAAGNLDAGPPTSPSRRDLLRCGSRDASDDGVAMVKSPWMTMSDASAWPLTSRSRMVVRGACGCRRPAPGQVAPSSPDSRMWLMSISAIAPERCTPIPPIVAPADPTLAIPWERTDRQHPYVAGCFVLPIRLSSTSRPFSPLRSVSITPRITAITVSAKIPAPSQREAG
jgi:hypothetical protein